MEESKKLVLVFKNSIGKEVSLTIEDPKDTISESEIKDAMDLIVAKNIFKKGGNAFVSTVEARIVSTQTDEYDLIV